MDDIGRKLTTFYWLLGNTLVASIINMSVWFGLSFFVYLETRSVLATGIIAGMNLGLTALSGFWFGSIVDHHKKKSAMLASSAGSFLLYTAAFILYLVAGRDAFGDPGSLTLWAFVTLLMGGVVIGNIRAIAMPTAVTLLVPEDRRDKANGLVGTASGAAFVVTSMISGFLVGLSGMFHVLLLALSVTALAMLHLLLLAVPEKRLVHAEGSPQKIDIKGTLKIIAGVPGLFALLIFTTFNNFLSGIFTALLDAYGLSLVSVQTWGLLWGFLTLWFIIGGLIIAKRGLGKRPLRTLLLVNVVLWAVLSVFTIQASIVLMTVGVIIYMLLTPYVEATEQTVLQKVVPYERQGRVFGLAQSMEQAAAPLMAFLIGPLTQFIFIPFMTNGGAGAEWIGSWYGTGADRGIALVFTIAGVMGLIGTFIALHSRYYRTLSTYYDQRRPSASSVKAKPVATTRLG